MSASSTSVTFTPVDAPHLDQLIRRLPDDAVVVLKSGHYVTDLWLDRPITIRGEGRVVIDGDRTSSTVVIVGERASVVLEMLTLRNGVSGPRSIAGGNLRSIDAKIVLRDVRFEEGQSNDPCAGGRLIYGGGGLFVQGGSVEVERCWFTGNSGSQSSAILLSAGELIVRDSVLTANVGSAPTVFIEGAARLTLDHSTIAQNDEAEAAIAVLGRADVTPSVLINQCVIDGPLVVRTNGHLTAPISVRLSALSMPLPPLFDGDGNVVGPIRIDSTGRPLAGSTGAGHQVGPK